MKKFYLTSLLLLFIGTFLYAQSVYPGNDKDGYGGPVGKGTLSITEDATNYNFTLTKGSGDLNDAVVIYLNTRSGGFNTTANFTDEGDGLRKAISGVQGSDRATLTFPSSFTADFAIAFDQGYGGVWQLVENGTHTHIRSVNLNPTGTKSSATYTFSVAKSDIAVTPSNSGFEFLVTYVSETGYRSNEFIGDAGPVTNPQNSAYTATSKLTFGSPLPIGFSGLSARFSDTEVNVSWNATCDGIEGQFEVQRSGDGTNYSPVGIVSCYNNPSSYLYSLNDRSPLNGNNYYRIAFIDGRGNKSYSKTIMVNAPVHNSLKVFASGRKLKVTLNLAEKGNYEVALINLSGQVAIVRDVIYDGTFNSIDVPLGNTVKQGIYTLLVRGRATKLSARVFIQ